MREILEQCVRCRHLHAQGITCAAFPGPDIPDVIPEPIRHDEFDHRQPYPGDHGIRWEPKTPGTKHPMDNEPKA